MSPERKCITVLLLPGLDGTGQLFEPMMRSAPSGFAVCPVSYPSVSTTITDIVSIVKQQQPEEHWIAVAESFSGPIAVQLAASQPVGLVGIVLVATTAKWTRRRWLRLLPLRLLLYLGVQTPLLRWLLLGRSAPAALVAETRKVIGSIPIKTLALRLREFVRTDVTAELGRLSLPVLYLQASEDRLMGNSERESVLRGLPRAESYSVPGPHFLLQTNPKDAWAKIVGFVRPIVCKQVPST